METTEINGRRVLPDCDPTNQARLTGHGWCPAWDNCECECHKREDEDDEQ